MNKLTFSLIGLILSPLFLFSFACADESSHRRAVDELFEVTEVEQMFDDFMEQTIQTKIKQNPLLQPYRDILIKFFSKYMSRESLKDEMANLNMSEFSEKEINEIKAFYRTPTGRKVLKRFPALYAKGSQIGMQHVQQHINELQQMLADKAIEPSESDAGKRKIITMDISARFINNLKAGKIFVITGKAKNGYAEPRKLIKITGKLYSKGKQLEKTEIVFCGNTLTDNELLNLNIETIKKRLSDRSEKNKANLTIDPGKVAPFIVVFSSLPDNLEEYTIEVSGSSQAS